MLRFLSVLLLFSGFQLAIVTTTAADEQIVALPPESIGQWYKPQNKRQVWLHNMFKLRREMQAVSEYLGADNPELLSKWLGRFAKHYRQIGEMVPQWQDELELKWLDRLESAVATDDQALAGRAIKKLKASCGGCHKEYQAVTALLYRTPVFSKIQIKAPSGEVSYSDHMDDLSVLVNRIKIASEDQQKERALGSLSQLVQGLDALVPSCKQCHKESQPEERILGDSSRAALGRLEHHIAAGDKKQAGRALGEVAVIICARCHGVHRTVSAARSMVTGKRD